MEVALILVLQPLARRQRHVRLHVQIGILLPDGADATIDREPGRLAVNELVADAGGRCHEVVDRLERVTQIVELPEDVRAAREGILIAEAQGEPVGYSLAFAVATQVTVPST